MDEKIKWDVLSMLANNDTCTREYLVQELSKSSPRSAGSLDRDVRKAIHELRVVHKMPILSDSSQDSAGYRLAKTEKDLPDVRKYVNETLSRQNELGKNLRAFEAFVENVGG